MSMARRIPKAERAGALSRPLALLALFALLAAACAGGGGGAGLPGAADAPQAAEGEEGTEAAAGGGEEILIGLLQPLTGPVAAAGIAVRDGAQIALDEINANGGVNGRPLRLVIEDTQNDPETCTNAASKVITRNQVVGIIGAWGSSCTLAVVPVVVREEVPLLVETSSSFKITNPEESGNEWTFRLSPPTRMEVAAVEDQLVDELGFQNVFFLSVNNDWGRGSVADFTPAIENNGGQVVGAEFFEQQEQDFSPLLNRVAGSGADSLIITTDAAQIALILEQMRVFGLEGVKVLTSGGSNFPEKVAQLAGGDAVEGVYFTIFFPGAFDPELSPEPERTRAFLEEWKARGLEEIELGEGGRGYDAVYTMAEALESLGPDQVTREDLRDALENVELDGVMYGHIQFGDWQDLINEHVPPIYVGQWREGKIEFVITEKPEA
jgi:branched-chain amino acid transport system substrate-binding protein